MKLATWDVIFSSSVIPEVSFTWSLIPRVAFIEMKRISLWALYIAYVKGVLEKFRRTGNQYNIKKIFKTTHILRSLLMKTMPDRNMQQSAQCVCSIPYECGSSYIAKQADL
jgi:hypothetical protein